MTIEQKQLHVFAGSYAESEDSGVYVYIMDEATGSLTLKDEFAGLKNPTFLNVDVDHNLLYAISETVNDAGQKVGEAAVFTIHPKDSAISLIERKVTVNSTTCHIQRDSQSQYLTVTSYHGGMIGLYRIAEDGTIGEQLDVQQHTGSSNHPERQDRPHPHSSFYSPDGRFLFVSDLGLDLVVTYAIDADSQKLIKHSEVAIHPGAGPRHFAFHPSGEFAYVINEIDSTVTSFTYDAENGQLAVTDTVSTLPPGFAEENSCAEIVVSADGKYVYGSNRGHDSIVVFAVNEQTGLLAPVQYVSVEGGHPRHFALTPNGNYLIAANRDTNNIVTFRVDQTTGKLQSSGQSIEVSKPVCVLPVYLTT